MQHIQQIELHKPGLSDLCDDVARIAFYCQQVLELLDNDLASGFTRIEAYKQKLQSELLRRDTYFQAAWEASWILNQLMSALHHSYAFDALPQCHVALSAGRNELIREATHAANSTAAQMIGQALSLAFNVWEANNANKVYWFYNSIVEQLDETSLYQNERNLCKWANAQRGYAFYAMISSALGGAGNVAHIIDEATAKRDVGNYGEQSLSLT